MIHQSTCAAAARAAVLHPLLLLVVGLVSWPADWDRVPRGARLRAIAGAEPAPSARPTPSATTSS